MSLPSHINRHSHLQKSTEANLQHIRWMSHKNNNSSSVLPGVSLAVGGRHTPGSCGITAQSESFLGWINGNGCWGRTCQGAGFVAGTRWGLNPCLCVDCGSFILCFCVCGVYFLNNGYKSILSVGGRARFQWFCWWVTVRVHGWLSHVAKKVFVDGAPSTNTTSSSCAKLTVWLILLS